MHLGTFTSGIRPGANPKTSELTTTTPALYAIGYIEDYQKLKKTRLLLAM
jgi:hypothetical protein